MNITFWFQQHVENSIRLLFQFWFERFNILIDTHDYFIITDKYFNWFLVIWIDVNIRKLKQNNKLLWEYNIVSHVVEIISVEWKLVSDWIE